MELLVGKVKDNFASLKKILVLVLVSRLFKFKKNFNSDYIEVAKKMKNKLLLDNGANIHARDNSKRIPIYYIRYV